MPVFRANNKRRITTKDVGTKQAPLVGILQYTLKN
jgi:hypothetical protein